MTTLPDGACRACGQPFEIGGASAAEHARLRALNAELLAALKALAVGCCTTEYRDPLPYARLVDMANAAIAKAEQS